MEDHVDTDITPTSTQSTYTSSNTITYTNTCPYGLNISFSSSTEETALIRTGSDDGTKTIPTIADTTTTLEDNTWGYSLDNGATYKSIPPFSNPATVVDTTTQGASTNALDLKLGVKLSSAIPSGSYTNDIIYTVSAKPQCVSYNLSWNLNGGTGASGVSYAASDVNYGSTINLQSYTPTRNGYDFAGWKSSATGNTFPASSTTTNVNPTNVSSLTLTAQWTPVSYTISYNLNGGSATNPTSYNIETNTFTLNNPTRSGYNFIGWEDDTILISAENSQIPFSSTSNVYFGPYYRASAGYYIMDIYGTSLNNASFDAYENNTSNVRMISYKVIDSTHAIVVVQAVNNATSSGIEVTVRKGSGVTVTKEVLRGIYPTATVTKGSTGNRSYTANWSVNKYTVTYEDWFVDASNNRKVKLGSTTKSVNYGTSVSGTELGTDTSSSKYYSNYSYRSATSGTVPANNNLVVYRYFYAWTDLNIYYAGGSNQGGATVSLSVNGSNWTDVTNETDTIQPYGTTYYIKNIRPVHSYEEFDRVENLTYNSSAGYYTYTPTAAGTSMSIWMKYKTYSISYNLNGGSASNPTSYNYTSSFTLNNPTRSGYNFTGWSGTGLSGSANKTVTVPSGSSGNRSYTANWQGVGILSISNMQDMTSALCSASAAGTTTTLKDTRDNNTYTVAKLNDGKCWMTQNLRLINKTVTPSDSNVSSNFVVPNSNFTENDDQGSHNARAYVWQTGNTSYGVYYNYYTATGGTIVQSVRDEAVYDICPKGWKMPSKAQQDALLTSYGVANNATGSATMRSAPLNFVYSGYINYSSSGALGQGSDGIWWSTTAYSSSFRHGIRIGANTAFNDGQYRCNGASIRCIAK